MFLRFKPVGFEPWCLTGRLQRARPRPEASGLSRVRSEVSGLQLRLGVGGGYLAAGAVCLCVLGFRATCTMQTYTHTHTLSKPQRLYWFQLIKAGGGMLHTLECVCVCVCEVNTFLTFQHFPKRHKILATALSSSPPASSCSSPFSLWPCTLVFNSPAFLSFPFSSSFLFF